MPADPNADLRNLLDRWTNRPPGPRGGVATTPEHPPTQLVGPPTGRQDTPAGHRPSHTPASPPPPSPPPSPRPARGDVVCWSHHGQPQTGVVQNVGTDGRAWLRTLDYLDRTVPQPLDALTVLATRQQLTQHAHLLLDPQDQR